MKMKKHLLSITILSLLSATVLAGCGNTDNNDSSKSVAESVQSSVSESNNGQSETESTENSPADENNSSPEQEESEDNDSFPSISIVTESDIEEQSWFEHTPSEDVVKNLKFINKKRGSSDYVLSLNEANGKAYCVCRDKNVTQEQYDNIILYMDEAGLNNELISERKMAELIGEDYKGERLTVELVKRIVHDVRAKAKEENLDFADECRALRRTIRNYMEPDYITTYDGTADYFYYTDDSKNKVIEVSGGYIYYYEYDNDGNKTLIENLHTISDDDRTSELTDDES